MPDLTSPLSTVVSGSTIDDEPPAQVSNLSVDVVVMSLNVTVENSSGALTPASNALDGDPATAWISPGVKPHREEWITVDARLFGDGGPSALAILNNQSRPPLSRRFQNPGRQ